MKRKRNVLYTMWWNMVRRCSDERTSSFKRYGARGIEVCDEWKTFESFRNWALENGYKEGLTIDRIDFNGNYCPTNCRFITVREQANNRSSNRMICYKGEIDTMANICRKFNLNYGLVNGRIQKGWDPIDAIEKPKNSYKANSHLIEYEGKVQSISKWAKEKGLKRSLIGERLKNGWTVEETLTIKTGGKRKCKITD